MKKLILLENNPEFIQWLILLKNSNFHYSASYKLMSYNFVAKRWFFRYHISSESNLKNIITDYVNTFKKQ